MPDPSPLPPGGGDVDYLVDQYVAGRLTDAEADRLLALLRDRPDVGHGLLDQLHVDALLRDAIEPKAGAGVPLRISRDDAATATPATSPTPEAALRRRWTIGRAAWSALAACLLVGAIVAGALLLRGPNVGDLGQATTKPTTAESPAAADEPTTAAVAVLIRTVDAAWSDPAKAPAAGAPLERGWLKLDGGLAEVQFFSGARVVLEGPGSLQLLSPVEAYCPAGRLSADVPPPAKGFRINTPNGAVVDLGTAFGLDVKAGGPEVHVFKGEVEVHPTAKAVQGLREGQAAAVGTDGNVRLFAADAGAFATLADLDRRAAEAARRRHADWRAAAATWNDDPALAVRFDFEGMTGDARSLPNRSRAAPAVSAGATVVGSSPAEGRWPGKGALEFRSMGDRVRLAVPGELSSFTLVASVRVHGTDRKFNSILMSDAFNPGAVHWQILNDGRVRLGIAGGGKLGHADYDSPVVFGPERLGRWTQLAVVFDAAAKRVTHYVDGRPVSRADARFVVPLRIGPAELGNWNPWPRSDSAPIRNFSGRMDDFAIYRRAMTDAEVERIHRADG
ncbi:MAG TPA: LamG-like jellyroll fold domain-containing protein [Humisphaera sp.]